ncbi:MAG TPA: TMEM14 family protein [Chlamydiales bacterium]|nr:TMEM14 family protein [Chlamydiales bacterium]
MDRSVPVFITIYGLLVIVLGIMGYQQAASTISLISGLICGILLIIFSIYMRKRLPFAYFTGAGISLLLLIVFCIRFGKTLSLMPGLMAILSIISLVLLITQGLGLTRK